MLSIAHSRVVLKMMVSGRISLVFPRQNSLGISYLTLDFSDLYFSTFDSFLFFNFLEKCRAQH